jgi:hypothetical protein
MYDPALARWHSIDPKTEEAYNWTPYRYAFNNPLRFIDPDGMFELDKKTKNDYPELAKFLKGMLDEWKNKSQEFKDAFYETSGMSEKQVVEMLTYGSGPKVEVENLDEDVDGDGTIDKMRQGITNAKEDPLTGELKNANDGKGLIKLDKNHTVSYLKNAKNAGEKQAAGVLVESTLYHEGTHYGNLKVNKNAHGNFSKSGKAFEKKAYGKDISKYNYKSYWQSKQLKPLKALPVYVKP